MVTTILIIPPLAFNQSLNALVSQAMGSENFKMAGTWLQLSLIWLTVSHVPVLIAFFFVSPILGLLGFPEDICYLAGTYAKFNAFWPIPNGWYQCMRFYFQAQGITRPAMYNNIIFLAVNALLNWVFVFGGPFRSLGWNGFGFIGAAISLSCSRSLQPLFYWLYMFVWRRAHVDTWPGWSWEFLGRERNKNFLNRKSRDSAGGRRKRPAKTSRNRRCFDREFKFDKEIPERSRSILVELGNPLRAEPTQKIVACEPEEPDPRRSAAAQPEAPRSSAGRPAKRKVWANRLPISRVSGHAAQVRPDTTHFSGRPQSEFRRHDHMKKCRRARSDFRAAVVWANAKPPELRRNTTPTTLILLPSVKRKGWFTRCLLYYHLALSGIATR
jgi:hypothetical protein